MLVRPDGGDPLGLRVIFDPAGDRRGEHRLLTQSWVIGRNDGDAAGWRFEDRRMSRAHARVEQQDDGLRIVDLGSKNGLYVNGSATQSALIEADDILRLGDTILEVAPVAPQAIATPPGVVATAAASVHALVKARQVARSDIPVTILGNSGTGKEVLAKYVHDESGRTGKLVAINCAALPKELVESTMFGHIRGAFTGADQDAGGLFAAAKDGTLFLDEIGELPLELQAKLLRAVESGEYMPVGSSGTLRSNARIICATNIDFKKAIREGRFRSDLYARLFGSVILLLPLAQRRGDILPLFERFATLRPGYTADFVEQLVCHDWPLNARELRVVVQRLELVGTRADPWDAPDLDAVIDAHEETTDTPAVAGRARRSAPSKEDLIKLLESGNGNVEAVATELASHRAQVYRWLKRYQLDPDTFRK